MMAEAITGGASSSTASATSNKAVDETGRDEFPEDKFHLRLPDDVDQYTGVKLEQSGGEEFAEDKFHRQDAVSQYIIEQRDRDIKAKWDKHEKYVERY